MTHYYPYGGVKNGIRKLAKITEESEGIEELGKTILERGYEASQGSVQSAIYISEKRKKEE